MKTVDLKMMTDSQEKISYLLQPLLEIAEQNRDIEEWNTHAESLLEVVQSLLDKQKQEERENGEFMVIAYDYEVGNTVQISIVLDSYQEALSFKESEYQKKENPNARVVKILEELKN